MSEVAIKYAELIERAKLYVERVELAISGSLDSAKAVGDEIRSLTDKITELTEYADSQLAKTGELRKSGDDLDELLTTLVANLTGELTGRAQVSSELTLVAAEKQLDMIASEL